MVRKIVKADRTLYGNVYKLVYTVHDEDNTGEFGFIALKKTGEVHFKITEDKYLSMDEVNAIDDFMKKLNRIENDEELNTLRDEYFYI